MMSEDGCQFSVRQAVEQVVHAKLVGLVGLVERPEPAARPLPGLRDVGVVVDDHMQPLARIVVFEDAAKDRLAAVVGLRKIVERR